MAALPSLVFTLILTQSDCQRWDEYLAAWRQAPAGLVDANGNGLIDAVDLSAWVNRCQGFCTAGLLPGYPLDATSAEWARFVTWVDGSISGPQAYGYRALHPALVWQATGNPLYRNEAIAVMEEFMNGELAAIQAGDRPSVAFDSYLYAGDVLEDLSSVYAWCQASLSAQQMADWSAYAEQTLFNIWNPDQASWGGTPHPWSGWSTQNPGNNYYYSFLGATLYWAIASGNTTWLDFACSDRWPLLLSFFAALDGGGSREGTGYGTSHMRLFRLYHLWQSATGNALASTINHPRHSIDYWIHAVVPTLDYFAPIGDQARVSDAPLYDYQRNLMLRLLDLFPATQEAGRAAWWLNHISVSEMTSPFNYQHELKAVTEPELAPSVLVHHATGVGHFFARSAWNADAVFLAMVAGPYEESHAHRDQGAFMLYHQGWQAVTQNIHSHSGIQQDAEVHNVLRFVQGGNTLQPAQGTTSTLNWSSTGAAVVVNADLTPAFAPHAGISSWTRQVTFSGLTTLIQDQYAVQSGVSAIWQINVPVEPHIQGNEIHAGNLTIRPQLPANPSVEILHWPTVDADHLSGYKVSLSGGSGSYQVELEITP